MIVLLDTTVLIDALRDRGNSRNTLARLVEQGHVLATSALNVAEVYSGMRTQEAAPTDAFIDKLEVFPITSQIARHAGSLRYAFAKRGKTLSLADMLVAATALIHGCTLMTNNRKDFPLPELTFLPA